MRTLLIDNHDSFTYNLFDYLAACNGEAPWVVRNDEMPWEDVERHPFDNIVISPGPGRPQRAADVGLSAEALKRSNKPVLGVCLGHQTIAHHCGATVDLAMRPMHGRIDKVAHRGVNLFRGIPNDFLAVRYHSLAVTQLPQSLEPLAWTNDGTLMALRHRRRPWWGVQFHPESISTEFGARLLRNFRELSEEWCDAGQRSDTLGSFLPELRLGRQAPLTLHAEVLDTDACAQDIFLTFYKSAPHAFWLDSSQAENGRARFSFMGDANGPHSKVVRYRSSTCRLEVQEGESVELREQSIFDYLREAIPHHAPTGPALPFDFAGGYVGYFGYELKSETGGKEMHTASTPDAFWILADRFIAFDHAEKQAWIVVVDETPPCQTNIDWIQKTRLHLKRPVEESHRGQTDERASDDDPPSAATASGLRAAHALTDLHWQIGLPAYRELILRCQDEILQGETYEVCLTNRLVGTGRIDALSVYLAMRVKNPAPYAAFLRLGDVCVLCASPELFLRIDRDRTVDTKPIKGTVRRGVDPAEDDALAASLQADEKSRSENLMIVDLLRNDLNRVCELGSVHVPILFGVETYATVHQLVSTVRGRLKAELTAVDCVQSAFPGGSMTGAPKIRTMTILDALEPSARGIYSGSIGYLSLNGTAQLNIVIRTIVCDADRVTIGAGGAIVALSNPDEEVKEIVLKVQAPLEILRLCGARLDSVDEKGLPPIAPA